MELTKLLKTDYPPEWTENGRCYKNEEAYDNNRDAICYIPECEYDEDREDDEEDENDNENKSYIDRADAYSHNDLLELCEGDEEACDKLFMLLDWSCPSTLYYGGEF